MSWRRILLLCLSFAIALCAATWALLQRSDAATTVVRRLLREHLLPPARVDGTELDLGLGRLVLRGLRVDDPLRPGTPLLRAEELRLDFTVDPFGELVALLRVEVDGARFDLGPTVPQLGQLLRHATGRGGEPAALPAVVLRRTDVRWTPRAGAEPVALDGLQADLLPLRGRPGVHALTAAVRAVDLGTTVQVAGELEPAGPAGPSGHATATLRGARIDSALLLRLQRLSGLDLQGVDASAEVEELVVRGAAGPGSGFGEAGRGFEFAARLRAVRAASDRLPSQIRGADVHLSGSSRRGGECSARLVQSTEGGDLDLTATLHGIAADPSWSLRARGANVAIDAEAVAAMRRFPLGTALMDALQPTTGRGDIDLFLQESPAGGDVAELDLALRGVAMAFHGFGEAHDRIGFPLPLVAAQGRVRLCDDVLELDGLQATIAEVAGGGSVALDGTVDTRQRGGEDATLDIRATGVQFGPALREAVGTLLRDGGALYDRLAPAGRANVEVHVRPRREFPGGWSLVVRPDAATVCWGGFPYRLEQVSGTVQAHDNGVDFDLSGRHGEGSLALRGHIPLAEGAPEASEAFAATVGLRGLRIDDELRAAVAVPAPSIDAPWRHGRPDGRLHGTVKVWRPTPRDELHVDVQLELDGASVELPCAPWRATGLSGTLLVQGRGAATRVDFDALRGRLEHGAGTAAELAVLGTWHGDPDPRDELAFVVRGLQLDAQLGTTLEQLGALGPGTWDTLRPSGQVDLVLRHARGAAGGRTQLAVQLVDVASAAPMLPREARRMTGELQVADGEILFTDLRAELGDARVHCRAGRVGPCRPPDGRTEIAFTVSATGFPVDGGLANLFAGPLQRAVAERQLQGRADVEELQLRFLLPPAGSDQPSVTEIGGQLRLYDVAMALGAGPHGVRLDGIGGIVTLDPSQVSGAGGQLTGVLRRGALRVFGQSFDGIETRFCADAERVQLDAFAGRLHGGSVRAGPGPEPPLHYTLPQQARPDGTLAANLSFDKVDVVGFLRECGMTKPPYSGVASGRLAIERLDDGDVVGARGAGRLAIERGDLGVVPLFTAIYSQLPAPERPRFDSLDLEFHLADRRVEFGKLSLGSNLLAANGKGSLDLDGYLDVELKLDNLLGPSADPVLMPFVDFLTQNIVRFHLFGHLRDLRAEKRWVTEGSPGRRRVSPMPPYTERPELPDK